jgi:plastocyanin
MTMLRILMLVAVLLPVGARADVLTGVVTTKVRPGTPAASVVVYAEPATGAAPARESKPVSLSQKNKAFAPRVLGVPVGTAVNFPNDDDIFHNVFSLSPGHAFDLGLYRAGASKRRTFTSPGLVRVFCNIHPQMTALIVSVATPFVAARCAAGPLHGHRDLGAGHTCDHRRHGGRRDDRRAGHARRERVRGRAAYEQVRQAVPGLGLQAAIGPGLGARDPGLKKRPLRAVTL